MAGSAPDAWAQIQARLGREHGTLGLRRAAPVVMAYPSPYRVGMSSLGFQTLYRILNAEGPGAHRAFLPDAWEPQTLPWPQPPQPVLVYESGRPISTYPILALSVAYELEISGVIRLLEGAGIPVLARDRGPRDPVVVAGGPVTTTNPGFLLPFVDLLVAGEAEDVLLDVVARLQDAANRADAIASAAELEGVVAGELTPGDFAALPVPLVADRSRLPAHAAIVTPDTELRDMFLVEPERGCSRQCTFCVMRGDTMGGMRLVELDTVLDLIPDHAPRVGLVGAAVTDHPRLEPLVDAIVRSGRGVGVSSLRADRLTPQLVRNLARGGYRTITVASDGISARMRGVLQRNIAEESLVRAAELVRDEGLHRLKVYEMLGAPGETDADVDELVGFAAQLAKIARITLTFSTFVAKRNTPLDGQPFLGVKAAEARLRRIRDALKGRVEIRPQSPKWAHIEYEIARRGPEVGYAALQATRNGGSYRAWTRALRELPAVDRALRYGDEEARARRRGKAANRPRLPVVS